MTPHQEAVEPPLLRVDELDVRYGQAVIALTGVSIEVPRGGAVAVLGSNGAGKTTLLRAVSGVLDRHLGHVVGGSIRFGAAAIDRHAADRRVKAGIVHVPEGRRVFGELTVEENLRVGRFGRRKRRADGNGLDRVYSLFPVLAERRRQRAGLLSGGEQQMLAIGRGLMASPSLLMLDEPSLGLAPRIIEQIMELLGEVRRQGTAMLIVEQNAAVALDLAEYSYVLSVGRVALAGPSSQLRQSEDVRRLYLGEIEDAPQCSSSPAGSVQRRSTL